MSAWAIVGGALAAGLLAWVAIAAVAWLGEGHLRVAPIRWFGAAALVLVALDVAGLPVHASLPPALMALGLAVGFVTADRDETDETA